MQSQMQSKHELRKHYKSVRSNIADKAEKSRIICKKLSDYLSNFEGEILLYYPTPLEVDIVPLIKELARKNCTKYLPLTKKNKIAKFTNERDLILGEHNIYEPEKSLPVKPSKLDIALVPGIAFDPKGNRLGHGVGWYDKFLSSTVITTKIGVTFDETIAVSIPIAKHDIKMDLLFTDKQNFNCR